VEPENVERLKSAISFQLYNSDSYLLGVYGWLRKVASSGCPVAARLAGGNKLQFNYEKLRAMGLQDATTQIKGQVFHLALLHPERCARLAGGQKHLKPYAHLAAELATWHKLERKVWKVSDKFPKPADFKFPDGLSVEEYFKLLVQKCPPKKDGPLLPFPVMVKACGSRKQYHGQDAELWSQVGGGEQEAVREQMLERLETEVSRGTEAGEWKRLWDEIKGAKKEKWYERLARITGTRLTTGGHWRTSWTRVSRKLGWGHPGRRQETRGGLTVAFDTSGSISGTELGIFEAKCEQMAEAYGGPLTVIWCDARVQGVKVVGRKQDVRRLEMRGGGGTSSLPVFELLEKPEYRTDCLVYLTDLHIDFPEKAPLYDVIWAVIGRDPSVKAPFGQTHHLEVD
jgi:predicted metal-dependent peptidase